MTKNEIVAPDVRPYKQLWHRGSDNFCSQGPAAEINYFKHKKYVLCLVLKQLLLAIRFSREGNLRLV